MRSIYLPQERDRDRDTERDRQTERQTDSEWFIKLGQLHGSNWGIEVMQAYTKSVAIHIYIYIYIYI